VTFEEFAQARPMRCCASRRSSRTTGALGEDLVQDVMLRAHGRWGQISEMDEPFTYVRRMLVNEFVSWRQKWARIVPRSDVAELIGAAALARRPADC
jgi:DNA-directed RNA polymerase specialized sigma24 family protein